MQLHLDFLQGQRKCSIIFVKSHEVVAPTLTDVQTNPQHLCKRCLILILNTTRPPSADGRCRPPAFEQLLSRLKEHKSPQLASKLTCLTRAFNGHVNGALASTSPQQQQMMKSCSSFFKGKIQSQSDGVGGCQKILAGRML